MPGDTIGQQRSTGIYQLIGLVFLVTIYPFVALIGLIGGLVYMVVDVLLKLIFDSGASSNTAAGVPSFGQRLFMWPIDQIKWIATGDGSFPWLP